MPEGNCVSDCLKRGGLPDCRKRKPRQPSGADTGQIETERYDKCRQTMLKKSRLYISSLEADAALINKSVRSHWGVENSLHWVLDVAFNEDHSRKRVRNAAQNFSLINRIALNLLKNEKSAKVGVKGKRLKAGWDNEYLLKILRI